MVVVMTTEQLIDRIAKVAQSGDWVGVQRAIAELKRLMTEEGRPLASPAAFRLVEALSMGTVGSAGSGPSPYALIDQIKKIANKKLSPTGQIDMGALHAAWETLYALLASSSVPIEQGTVREVLQSLQSARAFDLLAKTADRALVRDPDDAVVRCAYGQALIDSGRIHAGIDMLSSVLQMPAVARVDRDRAQGIIGRAYKQLYVDHVSASSPPSVRQRFRPFLEKAIEAYAKVYDANRPGENYWHGVNLVALLTLAREDGHQDIKNPPGLAPEEIARRIISALEPQAATASESWILASIGEAYLGLRDYEKAAKYFGDYARDDDKTDEFKLGGTIRQLEQVWRIHPGQGSAGAILAVLKAAQIAKPDSKFTLRGDELKQLYAFTKSPEYQFTETMVKDGSFLKLAQLQVIVRRAGSVAAMCDETGKTMGTGFVIKGRDLFEGLGDDFYLLTNAHVMSDPKMRGSEQRSLHPERTRVKLEAGEGAELKFDPKVIWQSPVAEYDAALVRLAPSSAKVDPLPIADRGRPLKAEDADQRVEGTGISVIGHPLGGPLSLSVVGTISGANGVLVDSGPRTAAGADPTYLHYRAPTEPGNSGSPVFETDKWEVVGLHHMGFDQFEGRPRLKGKSGSQFANEGICIQSIRKAIAAELGGKRGMFGRSRGS
jgi:S1-C subfamily serine protease